MQEKGCASSPRLGRSGSRRARRARSTFSPARRRRAGRGRREQEVDVAEGRERLFEPPAPHALGAADPGGGQQRAGEEAVAGVRVEVVGAGAQPVEMEGGAFAVGDEIGGGAAGLGGVEPDGGSSAVAPSACGGPRRPRRAPSPASARGTSRRAMPTRSPPTPRSSAGVTGSAGRSAQAWSAGSGPCSAS